MFYAIAIIITAYLPIFTLQRVEGRLFHPMAWTVAFALLGAILFAMLLAPVLASYLFRGETHEWRNPVLEFVTSDLPQDRSWTLRHRGLTLLGGVAVVVATFALVASGVIGSEFLPHLDEGAIWARGTWPRAPDPARASAS